MINITGLQPPKTSPTNRIVTLYTHITLHIWWDGNKNFSATPLRSRIKRVKQRVIKNDTIAEDVKECALSVKLSRDRPTKHILDALVVSIEKHSMGHSNITSELKRYLTSLMQNAYYSAACIATIIQKVNPTKKSQPKVNPPPQKELTEQPLETPQPSTSQAEGENQKKTHMTRGVKKLFFSRSERYVRRYENFDSRRWCS